MYIKGCIGFFTLIQNVVLNIVHVLSSYAKLSICIVVVVKCTHLLSIRRTFTTLMYLVLPYPPSFFSDSPWNLQHPYMDLHFSSKYFQLTLEIIQERKRRNKRTNKQKERLTKSKY